MITLHHNKFFFVFDLCIFEKNKRLMKRIIPILLVVSCLSVQCGLYDEGPDLSFRSKIERISNTWQIEQAFKDGEDISNTYNYWKITLTPEGYFFFFFSLDNSTFNINFTGTWELSDDKKTIIVYIQEGLGNTTVQNYEIIRLKENELWIKRLEDNEEWQMVPA